MADQSNPNDTWGPNEYAGQRVPLSGPIGIPLESGGLTFDRAEHLDVQGTKGLDKNATAGQPLGQRVNKGF